MIPQPLVCFLLSASAPLAESKKPWSPPKVIISLLSRLMRIYSLEIPVLFSNSFSLFCRTVCILIILFLFYETIQKPCIYAVFMVSAKIQGLYFKAADGNRTRDLRTTNATLYRLSHSSLLFNKFRLKRARDGTRTRDPDLGKVVLHQLSHSRLSLRLHIPSKPHIESSCS